MTSSSSMARSSYLQPGAFHTPVNQLTQKTMDVLLAQDDTFRCEAVHNLNSTVAQCEFVKNNSDCMNADGLFHYVELIYCNDNNAETGVIIAYGLWIAFLFIILGITTDNFFCPALEVISKTLRLSQNVAGVTFLALGNGAPDIFSSLAAVSQNRPELVISGLFGAGIFVSCVVAGSIMLTGSFELEAGPFLRDLIFYLAAAFWTFVIFYNGHIELGDALGFLALYLLYIATVLLGPVVGRLFDSAFGGRCSSYDRLTEDSEEATPDVQPGNETINSDFDESTPLLFTRSSSCSVQVVSNESSRWRCLVRCLSPVHVQQWRSAPFYARLFIVVKSPAVLLLKLTIPLVSEEKAKHNWCQILNASHCFIVPIFIVFSTRHGFVMCGAVPVWAVALILGSAAAVLVFFTSEPHIPPFYHTAFAYLGFAVSIVWIYNVANEIVDVLKTLGVVFNINDAVLGLTVLAWGNSVGDFIANFTVARNGSKVMGMSACYGGPLLRRKRGRLTMLDICVYNLLVGMGLPFTIQCIKRKSIKVVYDSSVLILSVFLFASLCSTMVSMLILRFHTKRSYGGYLLLLYVAFTTVAILNAVHIIS